MIIRWRAKALAVGVLIVLLATGMASGSANPATANETFGVESFESSISSNAKGTSATQAGSHPYSITTAITFNHVVTAAEEEEPPRVRTYGDPKDIEVNLPAGMIIDPRATEARCTESELESPEGPTSCPNAAAVGVFSIYLDGIEVLEEPVYNMAPPAGVPAELGFNAAGIGLIMHIAGKIRTGADYGLSADISDIPDEHPIYAIKLTLWGDPSAASHDQERGLCADDEAKETYKETGIQSTCPVGRTTQPFLTLPTACTNEPSATTVSVDSWQEPGDLQTDGTPSLSDLRWKTATSSSSPVTGCEDIDFSPKLTVSTAEPEAASAESPSGLSVDLKLPQEENVNGVAAAEPKEAIVRLPAGMAVSPSAAGGRQSCAPEQIGLDTANVPSCPEATKVGAAKIVTPLLEDPLEGSIYLAQQNANPFDSLLALYLVVEGGMLIKLAGNVEADPNTGQLTVRWSNIPQLPLSEMKLSFFGGERALLVTPSTCGTYEAQSSLTPWSGTAAVAESSNLAIGPGPNGSTCPSGVFTPSFTAGTATSQAGAFSPFSLTLSRRDGEQRFGAFTVRLPPGLLAILKSVAPCPEPLASLGRCPQASLIGTTTIGVGPGADQFYLPEPSQPANAVYLTGPYEGAPFGLSIVVPAIAGPFDLGNLVMRAKLEIDPHTAQLTITSDPLSTIQDGIPLDIRTMYVDIDRAGFTLNPTNCAPQSVNGTLSSTGGASTTVSSPFEAVNCASLRFKPKLSALAYANTSKADGAYLHLRLVTGSGQANVGKLKLNLPKQMPARLATLRRACTTATFNVNPAGCPAASDVGTATVLTQLLDHPLAGPVYLVSHGESEEPGLEIVLQGDGIRLVISGNTSIHEGIISEAFRMLPDVPMSAFDLILPTGPDSLLSANLTEAKRSLCGQKLQIATAITGQNGAVVKRSEKVLVSGCTTHSAKTLDKHKRQQL
jgi:hypothetical protein